MQRANELQFHLRVKTKPSLIVFLLVWLVVLPVSSFRLFFFLSFFSVIFFSSSSSSSSVVFCFNKTVLLFEKALFYYQQPVHVLWMLLFYTEIWYSTIHQQNIEA